MNIVQLPMEILMNIFSFLPTYNEVSLVNKLFYDIACKFNDSNTRLRINHQFVNRFLSCDSMGCQWLREIQSSKRQIPSVVLEGDEDDPILVGDQLSSLVIVVEKFSPNIKFLKLWYVTIDVSTFLGILSMVPNLECLELNTVDCPRVHQSSHKRSKRSKRDYHGDLDLRSLKNLSISWSDDKFLAVFNRLPIGVLTELKIFKFHWKALMAVLSRQWNIKKLKFGFIKAASGDEFKTEKLDDLDDLALDNFGKLTLESLSVYKMNSVSLATILSIQRNLKYLELDNTAVDETIMSAIADLAELEVLGMDAKETEPETLRKISKLKKLKDFKLNCSDAVKLKTIADSATTSINSFTMRGNLELSDDVIRALARSFPNLTHLMVAPYIPIEAQELHCILTHFNFVEVLRLHYYRAPADELGDYFNPKLRELIYFGNGEHCKPWMTKFMAAYPNIKKLTLDINCGLDDFNPVQIAPMLKAFTKLEWMSLTGDELSVADLDCLLDGKHNLRFLKMEFLKKCTLPEVIKKLRTNFEVTKIDEEGGLSLAVDRHTMRRERKKFW